MSAPTVQDVLCVIGMSALWLSLLKRLLYPALYSYYRTGNEQAFLAQGLYAITLILVALLLALMHKRLPRLLLHHHWPLVVSGVLGCGGFCAIAALYYPSVPFVSAFIGNILVACYLPIHVAFWAMLLWRRNPHHIARNTTLSFLLCLVIFAVLKLTDMQSIYVSAFCPLLSATMGVLCSLKRPSDSSQDTSPTAKKCLDVSSATATTAVAEVTAEAETTATAAATAVVATSSGAEVTAVAEIFSAFANDFGLSERETELTALAYRNYSAKRIAQELFIAESTVYTHLKRIYRKTSVHSRGELIQAIDTWVASNR